MSNTVCNNKECEHPICVHCDRPVRSQGLPLKDHPGTLAGSVLQSTCHGCTRRGGPPAYQQGKMAPHCYGCKKEFRPHTALLADHPGTVSRHSGGYCPTCKSRATRAASRADQYATQRQLKSWYLSDEELQRIRRLAPDAYEYHMSRRPYREAAEQDRKKTT